MTIAYDYVKFSDKPEKWKMRTILAVFMLLGIIEVYRASYFSR